LRRQIEAVRNDEPAARQKAMAAKIAIERYTWDACRESVYEVYKKFV